MDGGRMNYSKYYMTIIVPVYNAEKYLDQCVQSILKQKFDIDRLQVILINDGSTDNSLEVMKKYEQENIIIVNKKNTGVSDTRNVGLKMAEGKYILFLDSDDFISDDTCQEVYENFEKYHDEVDVLVYPIYHYDNATKKSRLISRFKKYDKSGIYDLEKNYDLFNPTINIAIVNKFEKNILFDTNFFFHEDEQYSVKLLFDKRKLLYLDKPKYFYRIHETSTSSLKAKPYFSYGQYMKLYQFFIDNYLENGKLAKYIQYSIFNDIKWRVLEDSFFPEYLDDKEYDKELKKIKKLFEYIDDDIIIHDSVAHIYQIMYYLVNFKNPKEVKIEVEDGTYKVFYGKELVFLNNNLEMNIYKYDYKKEKINICASVRTPFVGKVNYEVYERVTRGNRTIEKKIDTISLPLKRYGRNTINVCESYFEREYDTKDLKDISYYVKIGDKTLPTSFAFNKIVPFHKTLRRYVLKHGKVSNGIKINNKLNERKYIGGNYTLEDNCLKSIKSDLIYLRKYSLKKDFKPILLTHLRMLRRNWKEYLLRIFNKRDDNLYLYIDRYDYFGKSYQQFLFDSNKNDGIKRYYVTSSDDKNEKNIVNINSKKYRRLYLRASKIITSNSNFTDYVIPFKNEYTFTDKFTKEIILLNSDSLKFKTYDMFSKNDNIVSKIVVYNEREKESLLNNYLYRDNDVAVIGNVLSLEKNKSLEKKILFWIDYRKYLLTSVNSFTINIDQLRNSNYYQKIKELMSSNTIKKLLVKNDLYLDIKISDYFKSVFDEFKEFSNERIRLVDDVKLDEYDTLITDVANVDQEYLAYEKSILYHIFDKELINSNLHIMSDLTIDEDLLYGPISYDLKELENNLNSLIKNKFKIDKEYKKRYEFDEIDINTYHDRIYDVIVKDVE